MTDEPTEFAYLADKVAGCPCPAQAAGMSPVRTPAPIYDTLLEPNATDGGTVREDIAREHWLRAIKLIENDESAQPLGVDAQWQSDAINRGRQIATELGWMEDDDD